ncbi:MAG: alcohol dehydrogenase catalytic domain-containing protein [Streptosporangiaceae bacterium]
MRGAVIYGPGDVRFEHRDDPKIIEPTDAIIRMSATCVCGSGLWDYRGINPVTAPAPIGHEYCGIVEEVGPEVDGHRLVRGRVRQCAARHDGRRRR